MLRFREHRSALLAILFVSIAVVLCLGAIFEVVLSRRNYQIGTIAGQPIFRPIRDQAAIHVFKMENGRLPTSSADEQEVTRIATKMTCDELVRRIRDAVRETQMRRFGISVSQAEIDEYLTEYLDQQKRQLTALNEAASEIVDQKQDPEKVYGKLIAPLGPPNGLPIDWRTILSKLYSPPARARLAKDAAAAANTTVEDAKKAPGQPLVSFAIRVLEQRKLSDAVDSQLAAGDPLFRAYLDEWRKGLMVTPTSWGASTDMPREHSSYLAQKRMQFWHIAYMELPITLNDPTLADKCQLEKIAANGGM